MRSDDEHLFGWDPMPGIVSVWANRDGQAYLWRRVDAQIQCVAERFRPWLLATTLDDLAHLGATVRHEPEAGSAGAPISFRQLDGPAGSFRYLVSARSGAALERALLFGAGRRLGRHVTSLYDLDQEYYCVGPVEQYLMLTGRTYFQGLQYTDLHRLQFDLETTALDARHGRIFMVALRDSRGLRTTLEAPTPADEARLIADLCNLIQERDPDIIENHNLFGFDLPFLVERAEHLGVPLRLSRLDASARLERYGTFRGSRKRPRFSVPGRELIDTLDAVWRYDFSARELPNHRLKEVARHFGVAAPDRVYLPGEAIFATYQQYPEQVVRYALDDVAEVDGLSRRLLGAPFALARMAPRRYERLASAGPAMGILEPMLVRAYLRTGTALPRRPTAQGSGAEPHAGGALHLFATGLAERVVKADVASLYPSLMRAYAIGPACDTQGVLLRIVARLTDLRLMHKAAARAAGSLPLDRDIHDATQAAMKILINSAYGYMGAGAMALFADSRAADEVTRRGREVLDRVVGELRERKVALIEADTDGVFFAVPANWSEAEERALVAEVGARLDPEGTHGIRLEYEGRYQAMFSHEVKNYALLRYDGELILRGVALRSSRAEPFGERFLRHALHCAMRGDTTGLRAAFVSTVAAIRDRALPSSDLATRVRLTKSAEHYLAGRATHREPQYEALMTAGRTSWQAGERVRFYHARGNTLVWLPDDRDEPQPEADWEVSAGRTRTGAVAEPLHTQTQGDCRDYDVSYYVQLLASSYAGRLRKAFAPEDWGQIFRLEGQTSLFDRPIESIQPQWIRCPSQEPE